MNRLVYGKVRRMIFAVIVVSLILGIIILINYGFQYDKVKIGTLAYTAWGDSDYTVYISENGVYKPYLVLTNDYNGTGNTLLLRKEIIGGSDGFVTEYNGSTVKEDIYVGQQPMEFERDYTKTTGDNYLNQDFLFRLNVRVTDEIKNTTLHWSRTAGETVEEYDYDRKVFLLSNYEVGFADSFDSAGDEKTRLNYFDVEGRAAVNEAGASVPWWTRTRCFSSYGTIGASGNYNGTIGEGAQYGLRPAFVVSSKLKVVSDKDKETHKEFQRLDIDVIK